MRDLLECFDQLEAEGNEALRSHVLLASVALPADDPHVSFDVPQGRIEPVEGWTGVDHLPVPSEQFAATRGYRTELRHEYLLSCDGEGYVPACCAPASGPENHVARASLMRLGKRTVSALSSQSICLLSIADEATCWLRLPVVRTVAPGADFQSSSEINWRHT